MATPRAFMDVILGASIPILALTLPDAEVIAASPSLVKIAARFGTSPEQLAPGKTIDQRWLSDAWHMLADGKIDGYESIRPIPGGDDEIRFWIRGLGERPHERMVLVVNHDGVGPTPYPGPRPLDVAPILGTLDSGLLVERISDEVQSLGYEPDSLLGLPFLNLVHTDDASQIFAALAEAFSTRRAVSIDLRIVTSSGETVAEELLVMPMHPSLSCAFVLMGPALTPSLGADQVMQRIDSGMRALGAARDVAASVAVDFSRLSKRESEILGQLVKGDRVPQIAATLFISQSTVRNHLSKIFTKFGVSSQADLLRLVGARRRVGDPALPLGDE